MKLGMWKELIILLCLFGGAWLAFSYFPFDIQGDDSDHYLSSEKETELADLMLEWTLSEFDIEEDSAINAEVNQISQRLIDQLDSSEYDYTIRVVQSGQINAFATLGGNIFVFTGLIDFVDSPEELAVILAHEIGHVEKRHVVDKLVQKLSIEALFSILSGGDQLLFSEVSKLLLSSSFDRSKEKEADEFAYDLALKSGINPHRIAQFFIRTLNSDKEYSEDLEILMTHPHSSSRIKNASEIALPDDFEERPFGFVWKSSDDE